MKILELFSGTECLNDTTMGIIKLCTCGGCGIWALIDIFTAGKRTREFNLSKINEIL